MFESVVVSPRPSNNQFLILLASLISLVLLLGSFSSKMALVKHRRFLLLVVVKFVRIAVTNSRKFAVEVEGVKMVLFCCEPLFLSLLAIRKVMRCSNTQIFVLFVLCLVGKLYCYLRQQQRQLVVLGTARATFVYWRSESGLFNHRRLWRLGEPCGDRTSFFGLKVPSFAQLL